MKINRLNPFKNRTLLCLSSLIGSGLLAVSCSAQINKYTETDGVYYDPKTDIIPEIVREKSEIDNTYEHQGQKNSIAKGAQEKKWQKNNGYWDNRPGINSDWGTYAGTEPFFYDHYYWGDYGWYSPYRWGWAGTPMNWYGSYYSGMGWNFGFGWNSYFSPYYSYYSPYYYGNYPYWGYSPWGYYDYYGMGYPIIYHHYEPIPYRRSGATGSFNRDGYGGNQNRFRNSSRFEDRNSSDNSYQRGFRSENYSGNTPYRSGGFRETPSNRSQNWSNQSDTRSNGFNSSSSGGFRGSSSNSGGSGRSGGFR